jgi:hypothetical protein
VPGRGRSRRSVFWKQTGLSISPNHTADAPTDLRLPEPSVRARE